MMISAVLAPYITTKVLLMGANPLGAFAQGVGGVAQGALVGGVGAATVAVTGGAAAPAVAAAAALGAMAAGAESTARGGGFPQTTSTAVGGAAGLYRGRFARQQTEAMEGMTAAQTRRAAASEKYASQFEDMVRQARRTEFPHQPHHPNPNQAAIDIDAHAKS
jgi:type IV secretion system protein TrbL